LVRNIREAGKHKRESLYYMGKELTIPFKVVEKFQISDKNLQKLQVKYKSLKII